MHVPYAPLVVAPIILALNLPFGYWRARSRKFSFAWFAAIHVPVILSISLRLLFGIALRLYSLPLFIIAFFCGQYLGGRLAGHGKVRP